MRACELCGKQKADSAYERKGKAPSRACDTCRKARQRMHIKNFYRQLPPDERNRLTMAKRARSYGVKTEAYSRTEILARWGHTCCYCGNRAEHLDHVHPLSRGGEDVPGNIVPACARCNLSKGARSLTEWALTWLGAEPSKPAAREGQDGPAFRWAEGPSDWADG